MLAQASVGSNNMKGFNSISKTAFVILSVSCSFSVFAEKSHQQKYSAAMGEQVPVKCYVEYRGGGEGIQFAVGAFETPNQAKNLLLNREVTLVKKDKKSKKTILKVKECVKEKNKFSNYRAKQLDKSLPR